MNNSIKKQLKKMRVSPLSQQEKDLIWKHVCLGMSATPQNTARRSRSVSAFKKSIAITLIFGMTMGTASAANEAKPGDVLFPLDRAMEDAHLYIVSDEKKGELKVKFALERVDEVKEILGEISTKTKIKKAEEELETPPEKVEEEIEEEITPPEQLPEITEVAQTADEEIAEKENTEEEEINSSDNGAVETIETGVQVGSSDDDLPTDVEADTASSSEQENIETEKTTEYPEVSPDTLSQKGSTTENILTDQEKEIRKIDIANVEMSDTDKKRIELALGTALNFLGCVKGELAEQGNDEAASAIDNLLKDLNDEIETLPENITFEVKLSPSKQKVQFEITSEDDKDVVQIVEVPADENDEESGVIERLDLDEVPAEPKETKLEIKDGTLTIKTHDDKEDGSPATEGEEEETDNKKVEDDDENPLVDGKDTGTTTPDSKSVDPAVVEESSGVAKPADAENSGEVKPADAESSGVAKQKQPTTTDDVLNNNEDEDSVPTADTAPADGEDDGTTTVKVIIKKLDEDIEFSVTDKDAGIHKVIDEYIDTDEKGDA